MSESSLIRLAVAGAMGRTGRCVLELVWSDEGFQIAAALTEAGCSTIGSTVGVGEHAVVISDTLDTTCDVLVDFTVAEGTMSWLDVCKKRGIPMVIGVTGHSDQQLSQIKEAAGVIPILKASNFSVGIQAMLDIVGRLARELGRQYDIEIVETHHRHKVDAPSGTAHTLVEEIAAATGRTTTHDLIFGRHGQVGPRPAGQIGVHAVRMGDLVGCHEVHFSGPGETVTVRHTAHSRDTFAAGALRAAAWIVGKPPGLYAMRDAVV